MSVGQYDLVCRFLDTVGDGSGTTNMGVADHTGTRFIFQPEVGQIIVVQRLIFSLEDETGFKAETFGKESALANGLLLQAEHADHVVTDFLAGDTIKTNGQFGLFCYDVAVHNWANTPTDEILLARFTFTKLGPRTNGVQGLRLIGDRLENLVMTVQDDLTNILRLKVMAQGYLETLE